MFEVKIAKSADQIEKVYAMRHEIFVLGLSVPAEYERDVLDKDGSTHFIGLLDNKPIAVSRVVVRGSEAQIGRVGILANYRGKGYGKQLMEGVIEHIKTWQGVEVLFLHSMDSVVDFYKDLGFKIDGESFLEVGIVHVPMRKKIT